MSKTLIEFAVSGRPKRDEGDILEQTAFVAFKMWYDVSDPDKNKRMQYGAYITEDSTPEELDAILLDFARVAFMPSIKAEMEKVFGDTLE